ncbi:cytidine/deoxycytidylate deaminase family protein [candidate division KSB1 bacterium]
MNDTRISKDEYYIKIATNIFNRSTCLRRHFGAVIVNQDEIVATGYNGAPRKVKSSIEHGFCWRKKHEIQHGKNYELCRSVHAEQNAIIQASRSSMLGSTMYLVGENPDGSFVEAFPCVICLRMIINAGIERLVYRTQDGSLKEALPQEDWKDDNFIVVGQYGQIPGSQE